MKRSTLVLMAITALSGAFLAAAETQHPPLVPCDVGAPAVPCVVLASEPADIAGIWRQLVTRPDLQAPGGMGYQRINRDGSFVLADTIENTAAPYGAYPFGHYVFEDGIAVLTVAAEGVPPMCQRATVAFYVYRIGHQNVALLMVPIEDDCPPRLGDIRLPFVWVGASSD